MSRRCVFLDRDGVINQKPASHEYVRSWAEFRFLPNIADWIQLCNALGYLVIVVTNQRGIASRITSPELVDEIHANMIRELARCGARIDDVFVCPHEEGACECRKPKAGLLFQAQAKWDLDFANSVMIGDSDEDAAAAAAAGIRFLRTDGCGRLVVE